MITTIIYTLTVNIDAKSGRDLLLSTKSLSNESLTYFLAFGVLLYIKIVQILLKLSPDKNG